MACSKCEINARGERSYSVRGAYGTYVYDVERAEELVHDGRESFIVPTNVVTKLVEINPPTPEHLEHVRGCEKPGILARVGNRIALVDGSHRAALALKEGRPFLAYMLSQKESEDCLTAYPIPFRADRVA